MERYIKHIEISRSVVIVEHTEVGRFRKLTDLWARMKFFAAVLPDCLKVQKQPFRLSKSLRAAFTFSRTFDMKLLQRKDSSDAPTSKVGNDGDSGDSPSRCETVTL